MEHVTITFRSFGNKIKAIKALRYISGALGTPLGLKDAKAAIDFVEGGGELEVGPVHPLFADAITREAESGQLYTFAPPTAIRTLVSFDTRWMSELEPIELEEPCPVYGEHALSVSLEAEREWEERELDRDEDIPF